MFNLIEVVPPGFRPPDIESQGTGRTQETSKKKTNTQRKREKKSEYDSRRKLPHLLDPSVELKKNRNGGKMKKEIYRKKRTRDNRPVTMDVGDLTRW